MTSTYHLVTSIDFQLPSIPIGRPLPGYICQVLDEYLQPVAPGQIGELFISGLGVFQGYFHRPDLTQKALVVLEDGNIYYRTSDLVQMDQSANVLLYIGRKDFEIKLRGQRIASEEIEHILHTYTPVVLKRAVLVKCQHLNHEALLAYIETNDDNEETPQKLRVHCEKHLPLYMVPSIIIVLRNFPLKANGKIDRKALPLPNLDQWIGLQETIVEPRTDTEKFVLNIWKKQLNVPNLSVDKSFFALGGNSLLLSRTIRQYQTMLPLKTRRLPVTDFFKNSTISGHAILIDKLTWEQSKNTDKPNNMWTSLKISEGPASFAQNASLY